MTEQTIDVTGLPKGWKAVAIKIEELEGSDSEHAIYNAKVIAEKIKPRRKVLEETEVDATVSGLTYEAQWFGSICLVNQPKIWRIVEEE